MTSSSTKIPTTEVRALPNTVVTALSNSSAETASRRRSRTCAPGALRVVAQRATGSCLTPPEVVATAHGIIGPAAAVSTKLPPPTSSPRQTKRATASAPASAPWTAAEVAVARRLVRTLHAVMGTRPGQEHEWLPHLRRAAPALGAALEARAFRPPRPASWATNPRRWLDSDDIARVLRQYEGQRGFHFVGVFPRDFAAMPDGQHCVSAPMCALSVAGLRAAGHVRAGMVFNMDKHTQRGSHWAACYLCVEPRDRARFGVWYYDSVANPPPPEIARFMRRMQDEAHAVFPSRTAARFACTYNTVQRQFKDTECGVYACLFLVACLTTARPFQDICERVMQRDERVAQLRHVFFRPS